MRTNKLLLFFAFSFALVACNSDYVSKPRGFFRIGFPEKTYKQFDQPGYPFKFEYPSYGTVVKDSLFFEEKAENPYWLNIDFPEFGGRIHLSYKQVGSHKFDSLVNDAHTMSYKQHTYKAFAIEPEPFVSDKGIHGVYFTLRGNTATANQFFLTDSVKHFLRGALYFNATPNADSIKPVNDFFRKDVEHLINTLQWKQ